MTCTRRGVLKSVGFIPCVILLAISLWGFYAYVINFAGFFLAARYPVAAGIFIFFFGIFFILFLISFFRVVFTHPGRPPPQFKISRETVQEWEREEGGELDAKISQYVGREVRLLLKKHGSKVRYCDTCQAIKPDRTHHCSVCGECITKFDHHCPWINNCVGWRNYKFFLLFLFYGFLFDFFIFATAVPFLAVQLSNEGFKNFDLQWMLMLLISAAFLMALLLFIPMHLKLLLTNTTTLEDMEKKKTPIFQELGYWPFDVNKRANFQEVMGRKWWRCLLPIFDYSHDGINFPLRDTRDVEEGRRLMDDVHC